MIDSNLPVQTSAHNTYDWGNFIRASMKTRTSTINAAPGFHARATETDCGLFRTAHIETPQHTMACSVDPASKNDGPIQVHALFQLAGETKIEQCGRIQHFKPGDWGINAIPDSYRMENLGNVHQLVLQIPQHHLRSYQAHLKIFSHQIFSFHEGMGKILFRFLQASYETSAKRSKQASVDLAAITLQLLEATVRNVSQSQQNASAQDEFLRRLLAEILVQLPNPELTIGALAQRLGCSKSYLHQAYRDSGLSGTLSTYILSKRLEASHRMLMQTETPISQIAFRWGFDDPSYFSRVFKAQFGFTPTQARQH